MPISLEPFENWRVKKSGSIHVQVLHLLGLYWSTLCAGHFAWDEAKRDASKSILGACKPLRRTVRIRRVCLRYGSIRWPRCKSIKPSLHSQSYRMISGNRMTIWSLFWVCYFQSLASKSHLNMAKTNITKSIPYGTINKTRFPGFIPDWIRPEARRLLSFSSSLNVFCFPLDISTIAGESGFSSAQRPSRLAILKVSILAKIFYKGIFYQR